MIGTGANIVPLDHSVRERFPLITKLIAVCGGYQLQFGLDLDPIVCEALMFSGLWKNESNLINKVIKNIQCRDQFIELAFESKNTDQARLLLSNAKSVRNDLAIYTAAYCGN